MIVIGAGGHALEVLDVLLENPVTDEMFFYDDINISNVRLRNYDVLKSADDIRGISHGKFNFILGIGDPAKRRFLFNKFVKLGGVYCPLKSITSTFSQFVNNLCFDVMKNCFIGSGVVIGKGCLINTGAQIHHGVQIGEFTEISPRATILGDVKIGSNCSIGANATILPRLIIGSNVTIGAGSVVTHNIAGNSVAYGNPARVVNEVLTHF
ncbi:acetyltransferase [Mucilaginibacter sp.]|jgi:sugar O-acyltransferase (sialic acid O-acetyltransferase NeuD family)|uniref:acetyltransferase n=1 Tax=Mucilaginibacter sp. TaxID=1882438 RepID=UPI0025DBE407|nr:acetyltransferase [Mucilaginibacter sp.]